MAGCHTSNQITPHGANPNLEQMDFTNTLSEEQVKELLYCDPTTPNFTDNNDFPELPPSPNAHMLSPSPPQSRPISPTQTRMDDAPTLDQQTLEPLTRKRPISPDADGFTQVRHKTYHGPVVPMPSVAKPTATPVSNSFAPLRSIKPPPIVLPQALYDQSTVSAYLKKNAAIADYKIQTTRSEVKIFCPTSVEYEKIISIFKNPTSNVAYYTYAAKGTKKNKKFIILGLDLSHPIENIKDALKHKHLIDVRRLTKTDKAGRRTLIEPVLVTFSPEYDYNSHLKLIKHIDNVIIYHKIYKEEQTIPQCHRCQRMGHTKNHCNMEHRCVRCSGNHPVSECQRETTPLKCVNCGLEHPASYRGCEFRQKLLQTIQQKKAEKTRPPPTYIPAPAPSQNAWGNSQSSNRLFPSSTNLPALPPPPYTTCTYPRPTPATATTPTNLRFQHSTPLGH